MSYNESDTRAKLIDPALHAAGWNEDNILREYFFTDGRKLPGNKRATPQMADYLLRYRNVNLAIVEAKKQSEAPTKGLQQAIDYAEKLSVPYVYSTNGEEVYEFVMSEGKGKTISNFPAPEELYGRVMGKAVDMKERLLNQPFHIVGDMKPRYYQEIAVNKAIEAIGDGKKRALLTLATGTGKTFIAFQIVWKLFEQKWNVDGADRRPKILFLADRNILADQAINTFNPIEKDIIKIDGDEIRRRNGKVPTNANVFFAIYQAISEKENIGGHYKQYPSDFFDLVIIDECHRGGAKEAGSWRAILDHFGSAVHIGLTATPKREDNMDTYRYFGKPVYEYSLKTGIGDGFLTPYKVKRVRTNIDEYVHTTEDVLVKGELDKDLYELSDFERNIVIPERTELIAKTILNNIKPLDKTIVFCVNQDHALMIRDYINESKTIKDPHYCVRITSEEGILGRQELEKFQDNDKDIPAIVTTSQMLTTGVDARNVRNIVLVRNIGSMVEFKQIIGRGTRIFEGKDFFTIIDFTGATNKFYDDDWDGQPEEETEEEAVLTINIQPTVEPKEEKEGELITQDDREEDVSPKAVVRLATGREIKVTDIETRYIGEDGRPLSATEFLEKLIGVLPDLYESEEQLREVWSNPDTRQELLESMQRYGFDEDSLNSLQKMFEADDSDIFDVLMHVSFNEKIIKRRKRVEAVRKEKGYIDSYENEHARELLLFILERYEKDGVQELKRDHMAELIQLKNSGTVRETSKYFGGVDKLKEAFYGLQHHLYNATA
jgi:type I restriction enzyme R subunit